MWRHIGLIPKSLFHARRRFNPGENVVDRRVLRLCRNPGLNQGPLDLQSNALPTELFRPTRKCGPVEDQLDTIETKSRENVNLKSNQGQALGWCASIGGSVVECSPATRAARVRFPADASFERINWSTCMKLCRGRSLISDVFWCSWFLASISMKLSWCALKYGLPFPSYYAK